MREDRAVQMTACSGSVDLNVTTAPPSEAHMVIVFLHGASVTVSGDCVTAEVGRVKCILFCVWLSITNIGECK